MRPLSLVVLVVAVATAATARSIRSQASPERAADGLWQIAQPAQAGFVSVTRSFSQGLTVDSQRRVWCLIQEYDPKQASVRDLWLYRSDDGGKAWTRVAKTPCPWSAYGAIAGEPERPILHVAWAGKRAGEKHSSAVYQQFDTDRGEWLGELEVLQKGAGAEDQFSISDLAVGDDGLVALLVATHRHPRRPPWPSGWSSGLMMRRSKLVEGKATVDWGKPFPINTNSFAVWANLQMREGRAHATFRSSHAHSMIAYRSFSVERQAFEQPRNIEISVKPNSGRTVANASSLVVGPFGNRTVVYPAASHGRGAADNGQLLVSHAGPDNKWTTSVLCEDPKMKSGNVPHEHFALVRGPGPQAIALYSKVSEGFRVLYRRTLDSGKPMEPERVVARSATDGAYKRIVGMRDGRIQVGIWAVVSGDGASKSLGARAILAPRPVKTRWQ